MSERFSAKESVDCMQAWVQHLADNGGDLRLASLNAPLLLARERQAVMAETTQTLRLVRGHLLAVDAFLRDLEGERTDKPHAVQMALQHAAAAAKLCAESDE